MRLNYCDEENKQFQLEVRVREITEDRICLREHVWIDRGTWKLTNGDDEYALSSSYDQEQVSSGYYRVESAAIRFMSEPDYLQSKMLHPRWIGQEVFSSGGDHWGWVVDYEEDGYRKDDGRFVFHDTYKINWEFGTDNRPWSPDSLSSSSLSSSSLSSNDCSHVYPGSPLNIVLTSKQANCNRCNEDAGRWTWQHLDTDEQWCHRCHVKLHSVPFACPACEESVHSIRWGDEGWCDRCEQELRC